MGKDVPAPVVVPVWGNSKKAKRTAMVAMERESKKTEKQVAAAQKKEEVEKAAKAKGPGGRKRKAQSSGAAGGEPTAAAAKGQKTALEAAPAPVPEAALVAAPGDEAMETPPPKQPKSVDEVSSETKEAWRVS